MEIEEQISGTLLRAARILIGESHKRVVHELHFSLSTLKNLERNGVLVCPKAKKSSGARLLKFLDDRGVRFTYVDGKFCGVYREIT